MKNKYIKNIYKYIMNSNIYSYNSLVCLASL